MKGIELPINVLIIVAVAIIVLIAVIAMFYTPVNAGGNSVSLDVAKSQACRSLVIGYNCKDLGGTTPASTTTLQTIKVDGFDVKDKITGADVADTLMNLCEKNYNIGSTDAPSCRKMCGCAE
jgi:hypothetical protein